MQLDDILRRFEAAYTKHYTLPSDRSLLQDLEAQLKAGEKFLDQPATLDNIMGYVQAAMQAAGFGSYSISERLRAWSRYVINSQAPEKMKIAVFMSLVGLSLGCSDNESIRDEILALPDEANIADVLCTHSFFCPCL
ncbi:hypothetical protein A3K29_00050 [Candidatus Collierbacteria bacterium RIFOXYB2_FULL_46_14]|uniref:Uncharacterized protein n=1 Tax=Candidatus Collierbacteria bacterium GW2011_GWA2_46_26 TaxID=1618381 RepID=A0A0G1PI61_9BACT|nr:MAG: hypothetical protein UW29_C0012G0012 [Candidatus Collierbacteria bacterium GW2011_GWC2_44_13]KKU32451.1 MAG: hypothetical protein UX47_C0011G0012 [Candidatus Collierbacteria bacterium GW2011_GWA2_46_26]OGD72531.1 MAG: hypothetical protein A3K29_00050 [Candidatus Collierbacteria bacterium RIFOXYB2_FULL_46_14]OGD75573.1 MAG: hypothetical protein A3K43_00050 [Candidatus Collierbacteria bacterium RIFOXYA2_FULL_46_20]OGD76909.1 MAG: hypothetical protein A3K39_00050 [Candidatus Collierbacteri